MSKRNEQSQAINLHSLLTGVLATVITLWGLTGIYRTLAMQNNWSYFLLRQSLWAAAAWLIFAVTVRIKFSTLMRWSPAVAVLGALSLLLLPFCGTQVNGMYGWYTIGLFTIQPSEIFKIFYILAIARVFYTPDIPEKMRFPAALAIILCAAMLLLIQPDLGTMSVYIAGGLGALYFCNAKLKHLLLSIGVGIFAAAAAILLHPYMRARLFNFFNPDFDPTGGSWHLHQFAIAVSRGEWFGVKGDMAVWSNSFLPLAHNDSIFAAMCEILGFCGGIVLLGLYACLFYQLFAISSWRRDKLRRSVIDSAACLLLCQCIIHIAVNLNLLPPTGITLPLISYGGSSLVGTMLTLAVIISAGKPE